MNGQGGVSAENTDGDGEAVGEAAADDGVPASPAAPEVTEKMLTSEDTSSTLPHETTSDGGGGEAASQEEVQSPSTSVKKRYSVPETPRWRFVTQAKKTEGYSSVAAGSVVKGLSAEELVDKSKVPEWSVAKKELQSVKDGSDQWEKGIETAPLVKEQRAVGKLGVSSLEGGDVVEETFEYAGPRKRDAVEGEYKTGPSSVQKEEDVAADEGKVFEPQEGTDTKIENETTQNILDEETQVNAVNNETSNTDELATLEGENLEAPLVLPLAIVKDLKNIEGALAFLRANGKDDEEDIVVPNVPETAVDEAVPTPVNDDELDQVEKQESTQSVEEEEEHQQLDNLNGEPKPKPVAPTTLPSSSQPVSTKPATSDDQPRPSKKKRWALLVLILIIAVIGVVLGVLLGSNKSGDEDVNTANKAVATDEVPGPDDGGAPPSKVPTRSPTQSPSGICPANTKLFSIQYGSNDGKGVAMKFMTWVIKDACTGEEILRCLPCPAGAQPPTSMPSLPTPLTPLPSTSQPTSNPSDFPTNRPTDNPTRNMYETCVGPHKRPRPVRDGERFRFNLLGSSDPSPGRDDGQCVDEDGRLYERGEFDNVENFRDCAEKCVINVPGSLAFSDGFRGFDFDCPSKSCYCLYDQGTLDKNNDANFDSTAYGDVLSNELLDEFSGGTGEISSVGYKVGHYGYYCGKLVGEDDSDEPTYSPTTFDDDDDDDDDDADEEEDFRHRVLRGDWTGITKCLREGDEYVFEVKQIDGEVGECCAFVPDSFVAKYDNAVVMQREATDISSGSDGTGRAYFSERSEPCLGAP